MCDTVCFAFTSYFNKKKCFFFLSFSLRYRISRLCICTHKFKKRNFIYVYSYIREYTRMIIMMIIIFIYPHICIIYESSSSSSFSVFVRFVVLCVLYNRIHANLKTIEKSATTNGS